MMRVRVDWRTGRLLTALVLVTACTARERSTLLEPQLAISDAAHSGGTPGFFFLPPMVPQPVVTGVFDPDITALDPAVAICDVTDGPDVDCGIAGPGATVPVLTFTTAGTPAIGLDGDKYKVDWDTKAAEFTAGRTYRVHVIAGSGALRRELGFADILLTNDPGQVKKLADGEYITLKDGRTLPIHFRIEQGVIVPPGDAQALVLSGLPATAGAGQAVSVTVTMRDENGTVASGYRGTVTFTSSDPAATLPANYTFTEADAGVHTFTDAISFLTAGAITLRVSDAADAALFAEAAITILPADAVSLEVTGLPDPTIAGTTGSITVTARDGNGNVATGYAGTVVFTSDDPQATLPGVYTFTSDDAGTHTFAASVTLRTAGLMTVTATDPGDETISGSQTVTVTPSDAAALEMSGLSDPFTAGATGSIAVVAKDAHGNVATGYTGTIAFSSNDPLASLPASYTFTAADAGAHTFTSAVTLRTAGPATVTATDAAISIEGAQSVTVMPADAATLVLSGLPDRPVAGVASDLTVTVLDPFGNTATGYGGTVQFSSSDPSATLPPTYTFVPADMGVRTFASSVVFETAGVQSLQAADPAHGLVAALNVTVDHAPATTLRFTGQPSEELTEIAITPPVVVTAYDAFDNLATGFTGQVTLAIGTNPGGGVLSGAFEKAAIAGAATFSDLTLDVGGTYTLVASAAGLAGATSDPFEIIDPYPTSVHWINPAGGAWSVGSNWNTGTVPALDQTAIIDLDGTYTVTVDMNPSILGLVVGASSGEQTLSATGRTITVATASSIRSNGRLTLNSSTLGGSGTVTSEGFTRLIGGTLAAGFVNQGTILQSAFSNITGSFMNDAGGTLRIEGNGTHGSAVFTASTGFINRGDIELTNNVSTWGATLTVTTGSLTNAAGGSITSMVGSAGGPRALNAALDNQGTLTVSQALTINRASADHLNSGTILVSGGNLTVTQSGTSPSFTNTGTITVPAGRLLGITSGAFTHDAAGTLDGAGTVSLTSVNPAPFAGSLAVGALSLSNTTASFAADVSTADVALSFNNSVISGPGTITNGAGKTLTLGSTDISTAVINLGVLVNAGSSNLTGGFSNEAGATLVLEGNGTWGTSTLTVSTGFTNSGTIDLTNSVSTWGATLNVTGGALTNATGAGIRSLFGGGGGQRFLNAPLDNQGTLTVSHALTISRASADHLNSGTILVSGGNLTVTQSGTSPSFTNSGTLTVSPGRLLTVTSGAFTQAAGATLDGGGAVFMSSVHPAAFGTAFTLSAVMLSNTTASFATDISTADLALSLSNSTVSGPGTITNVAGKTLALGSTDVSTAVTNFGTLVNTGASNLTGGFSNEAGATLVLEGNGTWGTSTLTVSTGFTNEGTIDLTNLVSTWAAILNVTGGTLTNATGAGIRSLFGGGGGGRALNAPLDNQGTLTVSHPLTISRAGADHLNSGTILVSGGNLTLTQSGTSPSFTNTGTLTVSAGRALSVTSGAFTQAAGATLDGGGAVSMTSVNPAAFGTAFTLAALTLNSTTASFATDISTADVALTFNNSTVSGPGTITNVAGKTLALGSTDVATAVTNFGTLVNAGASNLTGGFSNEAGATLEIEGNGTFGTSTLTVSTGFTNSGTIDLTNAVSTWAAILNVTGGTLTNATGASIRSLVGGGGGGRALNALIDNQGTLTVSQALTVSRASADHLNSGTILVSGGNLTLTQSGTSPSFTNTGTLTVSAGRALSVTSGAFTQAAGATLDGGGAVSLSSVNPAAFATAFTLAALTLNNTTASFATDVSTADVALSLNNSVLNGPGIITNATGRTVQLSSTDVHTGFVNHGVVVSTAGSNFTASLSNETGSTLRVEGNPTSGSATLTVLTGFTNRGTIELTNSTSTWGATLGVTNGTLTNAPEGTIAVLAGGTGAGGLRALNAQLDNQGTFTVSHLVSMNRGGSDHSNSGSISIAGGQSLIITQSGTTPSLENSGTIDIAASGLMRTTAGTVNNVAGGEVLGNGTFEITSGTLSNSGSVTTALARIGGALTSDAPGGWAPVTTEFIGSASLIPVGAGFAYTNIRSNSAATTTFGGSLTVPGFFAAGGSNLLSIGGNQIEVQGDFTTSGTAALIMQNSAGMLTVGGSAVFGGGTTNTRLTAGVLEVAGDFMQQGNSAAFAASGTHLTVLNGTGAQTVSFTNPGTAVTASHFARLEIENASAGGIVLAGAAFANGQLRTPSGVDVIHTVSGSGGTLTAGGLDAYGLVFDNVPLRIVNGEALARFDAATFRNMDPTVTQLRLDRQEDAVTFNNTTFETLPTSGFYLHLVDTDLVAPIFTVTMTGTTPATHGGRVIESAPGQLLGWPAS